MPFDGSGNYSPPSAPTFPAVSGQVISSTYYNSTITDIATALQNCLTRDNQGKPSAHMDWNAKNLTNVAAFAATGNGTIGGTLGVTGNTTVGGTFGVTGATTLSSTLAAGNTTITGTLGVSGAVTLSSTLAAGNTTITGTLAVSGATTIGGATPWTSANDGAGSGLDADLLDGLNSAAFAQLSGATFTGGVSGTTLSLSSTLGVSGTLTGAGATFTSLSVSGSAVWTAGNDGAGSGLDADLLDGVNGLDYQRLPRSTTSGTATTADIGKCIALSAGMTIPNATFAAGDAFSLYNDTAGSLTITQGASLTLRQAGTSNTGNRTLALRGVATIWFNSSSEAVISGSGLT